MATRTSVRTGRPFEVQGGFSRGVRVDNPSSFIYITGCTSTDTSGKVLNVGDPYAQAKEVISIIESVLQRLNASLENIVRTRIYVVDILKNGDAAGKAHLEAFDHIQPAETMIGVVSLAHPDMLVEIDADAVI